MRQNNHGIAPFDRVFAGVDTSAERANAKHAEEIGTDLVSEQKLRRVLWITRNSRDDLVIRNKTVEGPVALAKIEEIRPRHRARPAQWKRADAGRKGTQRDDALWIGHG